MTRFLLPVALLFTLNAWAQTPLNKLWIELEQKRVKLAGAHQEFEMTVSYRTPGGVQAAKRAVVVDMSQGMWREASLGGAGDRIRIHDGKETYEMEEGGDEFVRVRSRSKAALSPGPYAFAEIDWGKSREVDRRPCGFAQADRTCIVFQLALKTRAELTPTARAPLRIEGVTAAVVDSETGLLVQSRTQESVSNQNGSYIRETSYSLTRLSAGSPADASVFDLPQGLREVKELSRWDASRIRKQLVGKPAPELTVTDIQGLGVSLAALKGKTVLLDFWTTWCPPCKADGPDLERLHKRYGDKLAIVGISVDEERAVVEKYLREQVKSYSIVLTSENEMPRPYQIGVFPTYIVIDEDGAVTAAVQGEKGFGELRSLLQKAGIDAP